MAGHISMKRNTKRGFYTLEAAIFLPLVILAVLSLAYFMRVEGTWENCIHGAVDESALIASRSYDKVNAALIGPAVSQRINDENPALLQMRLDDLRVMYADSRADDLTSYDIHAVIKLELPLGFSREFILDQGIKFRGFTGVVEKSDPLGIETLETYEQQKPVWIFPHAGEKYHAESCSYVKAAVSPKVLTSMLKKEYSSCGLCSSGDVPTGSIVFCFEGEDTAYHYGTCRTIDRHTSIIDESEAVGKGYRPCSKCGG